MGRRRSCERARRRSRAPHGSARGTHRATRPGTGHERLAVHERQRMAPEERRPVEPGPRPDLVRAPDAHGHDGCPGRDRDAREPRSDALEPVLGVVTHPSLGKDADARAALGGGHRLVEGPGVTGATADTDLPGLHEDPSDHPSEDLGRDQVAGRSPSVGARDGRDRRAVEHAEVVRRQDHGTGPRDVLDPLDADPEDDRHEGADQWRPDRPDPVHLAPAHARMLPSRPVLGRAAQSSTPGKTTTDRITSPASIARTASFRSSSVRAISRLTIASRSKEPSIAQRRHPREVLAGGSGRRRR